MENIGVVGEIVYLIFLISMYIPVGLNTHSSWFLIFVRYWRSWSRSRSRSFTFIMTILRKLLSRETPRLNTLNLVNYRIWLLPAGRTWPRCHFRSFFLFCTAFDFIMLSWLYSIIILLCPFIRTVFPEIVVQLLVS